MARYVSIDIETTGLDPAKCDVIEFGAVIEVTGCNIPVEDLPSFHAYVTRSQYKGDRRQLPFLRVASPPDVTEGAPHQAAAQ